MVYNENQRPVGEISFHCYDENEKSASFNIKIQARYRGKGYAKATMDLMLDYYFNEFGGEVMIDEVINERGIRVLMSYGFEKVDKTEVGILLRLTKDKFNMYLHKIDTFLLEGRSEIEIYNLIYRYIAVKQFCRTLDFENGNYIDFAKSINIGNR